MNQPVLSFNSSREHYAADCCIVWCFDDRFSGLLAEFQKQFSHNDLIRIAGGAKALANGASPERDFVAGQIATSLKLHATKKIALMTHRDCGGYGGSKAFASPEVEEQQHASQLAAAREFLKAQFPDAMIECYFGDFDGLHQV